MGRGGASRAAAFIQITKVFKWREMYGSKSLFTKVKLNSMWILKPKL